MGVVSMLPIASHRHRLMETSLLTLGASLYQSIKMMSTIIINLYNAIYCKLSLIISNCYIMYDHMTVNLITE